MRNKIVLTRKVPLLVALYCISLNCLGQADSLAVVRTKWDVKKLGRGIHLKHSWYNKSLFGSNQNINILEVRLKGKNTIDVAAEPQVLKQTSAFGSEYQALAAINGTFFDMKNGGSVDYIRIDDSVFHQNRLLKNNQRALHQKAAVVIQHKKVLIEPWDGSFNWEDRLGGTDIMVAGPLLLKDDQRTPLDSVSFNVTRHPRTAVALKGNKVLLITIDGRNEKAAGMSLFELASFLKWLGVDDALNLDGGGSTTMWIRGFSDGGIVNHPSDNRKMEQAKEFKKGMDLDNFPPSEQWDRSGERPVANVLLVNKKK